MTPAARLSAAITVLDQVLAGQSAEQALTNWGRASRFAGSGDRAAVRQANTGGEFMDDDRIEALRRIARHAWRGPDGREQPFLSADEVETLLNLLVRTTANIPFVNEYEPPAETPSPAARKKKA